MSKLLLAIDVQKDFINEQTLKTLNKIKRLIDSKKYDIVAFTRFINDEDSIWYKKLNYKGCMTKEQQEIAIDTQNYRVFDKRIYTAMQIDKYGNDVGYTKRLEDIKSRYGENSTTYKNAEILISKLRSEN